jgi:hypothetical protein
MGKDQERYGTGSWRRRLRHENQLNGSWIFMFCEQYTCRSKILTEAIY